MQSTDGRHLAYALGYTHTASIVSYDNIVQAYKW